jgi:hypothetical protein
MSGGKKSPRTMQIFICFPTKSYLIIINFSSYRINNTLNK